MHQGFQGGPVAANFNPGNLGTRNHAGALNPIQGSVRPGTGLRRLPTAGGAPNPDGPVGLNTNINVDFRPVTQQGLTGMNTKPLGPGRQLADSKYYLNLLRTKQTDIDEEIKKMKQEMKQVGIDNELYGKLSTQYEDSIAEVRNLEGQLADFNLAVDKLRTQTPVAQIIDAYEHLKASNARKEKQVDSVFSNAHETESKTRMVMRKMEEIHQAAAAKLQALGDELVQEYDDLQEESQHLDNLIKEKEEVAGRLDLKMNEAQRRLKSDDFKTHQRGMELKKTHKELLKKKQELEEETSLDLSPEEMKQKLVTKVKDTNARISELKSEKKKLEAHLENLQDTIERREKEITEAKRHAQKAAKYEQIFEKEKKMTDYIENFHTEKKAQATQKKELQQTVLLLLKHVSKGLGTAENLPDKESLSQMKDDLEHKEGKVNQAKDTLVRIKKDLQRRKEELKNIENLDKKINLELETQKKKIESMRAEMKSFKTVEQLHKEAKEAKKILLRQNMVYRKRHDAVKTQVSQLSEEFDQLQRTMLNSDTYKRLQSLEDKLRLYAQRVANLDEFITSRKRESDYHGIRQEVMGITQLINQHTIKEVNTI